MKVVHIVGARPNFMKMAPILEAMRSRPEEITQILVHTGQHYDEALSGAFFRDLGMPTPDINLDARGGSHAEQTARVMLAFEPVLEQHSPDWVVVVGDVNSTLACALVAAKRGIRVAHVEAGLRSFDRTMPEEINRVVTDRISDLLLTPSADADLNLLREGIEPHRIVRVGNVMIDTLVRQFDLAKTSPILDTLGLEPRRFAVATLHRPANVDSPEVLRDLLSSLGEIARELPVVFPTHPRTQARIKEFGIELPAGVSVIEPLGYRDFLKLWSSSRMVLTDSGGLQEETTALGVPCLTLRDNTERPITIEQGTNHLVGRSRQQILTVAGKILGDSDAPKIRIPEFWDGQTADRIVLALLNFSHRAPGSQCSSGIHQTTSPFTTGD
ncbi:MAG: UDP-N-acetylglucosamine 2-epimerase (non-hydrolyzing) [Blastocatellia bacterium]|nr:UDP-N-acetylglucosamine 2-epimerase (non-hydrolyzing) [Blastocatellia bacterium]